MDNEVAAGNTASTLGHLALGLTLLAFGLGGTGVIDNVAAADAAGLATWVGGVRAGDKGEGTAYAGLGAFWFTWGTGVGGADSADAAGLFLLLWALLALTLTMASSGSGLFGQGVYGLLFVALLLLGIGALVDNGGLGKAGGWVAALAGLVAWYGATAAVAGWPTSLRRAASAPAAG
ncbi:GPR1/FUN34/YaaH family transporter [Streptomyces sp. SS]|uniref:GPR1/FUN34/YaaH family transporter n=1 Tax=Streptomyces sp. SS TaxID=260742 RepID=UPI00031FA34C|nr:GPR1/FUN34/YaaH family transporter [Streptomyces sp. SS]